MAKIWSRVQMREGCREQLTTFIDLLRVLRVLQIDWRAACAVVLLGIGREKGECSCNSAMSKHCLLLAQLSVNLSKGE